MRKVLISLAAAGAALVAASPAAAQYYPVPQPAPYGYNGYGYNSYGYNGGWGQVRALQARIDNVERRISWLDRRDRIGDRSADRLRYEADRLEQRLHYAARGGLNPYEARDIEFGIGRLEQRIQYAVANGYGRDGWRDRDDRWGHDGRWDRDDRWDRDRD
jgi:hypothetical protein